MVLVDLVVSLTAFADLLVRSVTVTRAFARLRVRLVTWPVTVRLWPAASAADGGELTERSFVVCAAACADDALTPATAAHAIRHANDCVSRTTHFSSPRGLTWAGGDRPTPRRRSLPTCR